MPSSGAGSSFLRSVIAAVGTAQIRRVKLGIGRPAHKHDVPDHVLTTFENDELPVVDQAVETAADRVLELLARAH